MMKAYLMFENDESALQPDIYRIGSEVSKDLEIDTLCKSMAAGNEFLYRIAMNALLSGLNNNLDIILYRQEVLKDCLDNSQIIREMYKIAVEAIESKKKHWWIVSMKIPFIHFIKLRLHPERFDGLLKQLKNIADGHAEKFKSKGFARFFATLVKELDDDYFNIVENHLQELEFPDGILLSASLTKGNKGTDYTTLKSLNKKKWYQHFFKKKTNSYTFRISDRDVAGLMPWGIKRHGINSIANIMAQSADHIINFFNMLMDELAFYIGCQNLYEQLIMLNERCISGPR
jgi:hypothetical protein